MSIADTPTPPAMTGTWTLIAPDGRQWQASSPLKLCKAEMDERVPADIALARIMLAAATESPTSVDYDNDCAPD